MSSKGWGRKALKLLAVVLVATLSGVAVIFLLPHVYGPHDEVILIDHVHIVVEEPDKTYVSFVDGILRFEVYAKTSTLGGYDLVIRLYSLSSVDSLQIYLIIVPGPWGEAMVSDELDLNHIVRGWTGEEVIRGFDRDSLPIVFDAKVIVMSGQN